VDESQGLLEILDPFPDIRIENPINGMWVELELLLLLVAENDLLLPDNPNDFSLVFKLHLDNLIAELEEAAILGWVPLLDKHDAINLLSSLTLGAEVIRLGEEGISKKL